MLEELFGGLVSVEQTDLQVEHRLTCNTKTKMTGLDDASVNRTYWHLKNAFALHWAEEVAGTSQRLRFGEQVKVLTQRIDTVREIVMQCNPPGIGMPRGRQAKPVLNLPLLPVDCGN